MEVSDLKSFIYADNITIWGDDMKELEKRLAHWEKESKNYGLQVTWRSQ
jgi:type IV secretory pathway VirB4 component